MSVHRGKNFIYDSLFKPHNNFPRVLLFPLYQINSRVLGIRQVMVKETNMNLVNICKTPDVE